ncbi:MAG TPA: hypothetical protein VFR67_23915, partial [Pilimelia sp.]|nr:hypothetical protein [Pilimelia sp.]
LIMATHEAVTEEAPTAEAIELASYLTQLGDPVSMRALRALVRHPWFGRGDVISHVHTILGGLGDDPARNEWLRGVGLEPPPRG